jgi:cellulose biosynthesis protein BcsQ
MRQKMLKNSTEQTLKLEKIATNLNYLLASKSVKALAVISEFKGEGKSTFISTISPIMNTLYSKRVLVIDCTHSADNLDKLLGVDLKDSSITKSTFKGIDYISLNNNNSIVGLNDSRDFYDLILINTDLKSLDPGVLPSIKIDGAILIKSKKSADLKEETMGDYYSDLDIPVVGVLYNEAR